MRRWQLAGAGVAVLLAGCGGVTIAPKPVLPKALVQEIPATVGLLVPADQSSYAHSETRAGVVWSVALGQGQQVGRALGAGKARRAADDGIGQQAQQAVQQAQAIGLAVPDPDLVWNEQREHYDFGAIDWEEFQRVVSGNGPCNRQRLAHHVSAHKEGAWVREAMAAYEAKRRAVPAEVA